jgi:hypothetical protein
VQKDCHIHLLNNYYSVPSELVGQEVEISCDTSLVRIYDKSGKLIASHPRSKESGNFITNRSHYPEYKLLYPESPEYKTKCEEEIASIGDEGAKMLIFIKEHHSKSWTKIARGILALKKDYSNEVLRLALKRALYFGITSHSKIQDIITKHCYRLPLPGEEEATKCIA